jgi:hypothetical protein
VRNRCLAGATRRTSHTVLLHGETDVVNQLTKEVLTKAVQLSGDGGRDPNATHDEMERALKAQARDCRTRWRPDVRRRSTGVEPRICIISTVTMSCWSLLISSGTGAPDGGG